MRRTLAVGVLAVLVVGAAVVWLIRPDGAARRVVVVADATTLVEPSTTALSTVVPTTVADEPVTAVDTTAPGPSRYDGKASMHLPITVEPANNIRNQSPVTVTSSQFPPGRNLAIVMCAVEAREAGVDLCDVGHFASAVSDASGTFSVTFEAWRFISTRTGGTIDCGERAERCIVAAAATDDYNQSGGAPVSFDPAEPLPPPPVIDASPTTGLRHGSEITVTASGFSEESPLLVCVVDEPGLCSSVLYPYSHCQAECGGSTWPTMTVRVARLVHAGARTVDCADVTGRCALVLRGRGLDARTAPVPLDFDASVPLPVTTIEVTPGGPFADHAAVTVRIAGLLPGEAASLGECVGSALSDVMCDVINPELVADETGAVTLDVTVVRRFYPSNSPPGTKAVDCAEAAGRCFLASNAGLQTPLTFSP